MSSPAARVQVPLAPGSVRPSRSNGWWGMLLLVATEAALFGVLIASYFYVRFRTVDWPPDGIPDPKALKALGLTVLVVATTVPIYLAERGIRRGSQSRLRLGLIAATLIAALYTVLQAYQLNEDWKSFTARADTYGSLYFTITGAHLVHVAAGVLLIGWVTLRAWGGAYAIDRNAAVQVTALYWYFVNALAVVVFLVVDLSPVL